MSKYFERQLEELHVQLITLGSYCEKAISFSAKAIQNVQNEEIARQVFETDRDIDAKEREIENLCLSLLLHQHPVARDLREISAALYRGSGGGYCGSVFVYCEEYQCDSGYDHEDGRGYGEHGDGECGCFCKE